MKGDDSINHFEMQRPEYESNLSSVLKLLGNNLKFQQLDIKS